MNGAGKIDVSGPRGIGATFDELIQNDKQYGKMTPRNGIYFTFKIIDTQDNEISKTMLNRAVKLAWLSWSKRINITVKEAKSDEMPDFQVIFRTPQNDERREMQDGTIMYHYFPINNINHPNRGLCVINPNYYFTVNGNPFPLHVIDPEHYDENSTSTGSTVDLDAVLRHEFGHGLGLPHDPEPGSTMSTPYKVLSEFLGERDVMRGIKKYGFKKMRASWFVRWWNWIRRRSENYG